MIVSIPRLGAQLSTNIILTLIVYLGVKLAEDERKRPNKQSVFISSLPPSQLSQPQQPNLLHNNCGSSAAIVPTKRNVNPSYKRLLPTMVWQIEKDDTMSAKGKDPRNMKAPETITKYKEQRQIDAAIYRHSQLYVFEHALPNFPRDIRLDKLEAPETSTRWAYSLIFEHMLIAASHESANSIEEVTIAAENGLKQCVPLQGQGLESLDNSFLFFVSSKVILPLLQVEKLVRALKDVSAEDLETSETPQSCSICEKDLHAMDHNHGGHMSIAQHGVTLWMILPGFAKCVFGQELEPALSGLDHAMMGLMSKDNGYEHPMEITEGYVCLKKLDAAIFQARAICSSRKQTSICDRASLLPCRRIAHEVCIKDFKDWLIKKINNPQGCQEFEGLFSSNHPRRIADLGPEGLRSTGLGSLWIRWRDPEHRIAHEGKSCQEHFARLVSSSMFGQNIQLREYVLKQKEGEVIDEEEWSMMAEAVAVHRRTMYYILGAWA